MDTKRLQELAGMQLNENKNINTLIIKHIRDIIVEHATGVDKEYFAEIGKEDTMGQVEEMIVEQFEVLRDDLAPSIKESVELALFGK